MSVCKAAYPQLSYVEDKCHFYQICELVELYIQSNLDDILPKTNFALCRDDGLILLGKLNGQQMYKKRKTIIKIFNIDIQINLKEVDFLDVALNLQNYTYSPYKKANDKLLYIHSSSNLPPQIIKQLPNSISERLSKNSSNQEVFNTAKVEYEDALKKSGYNVDLKYTNNKSEKPKTRKRNIISFNPPFTKSFSTNVAKTFLQLVTKHFPRTRKLQKIFNRNTVKVSYSCMNNMSYISRDIIKKSSWNHMIKDQNAIAEKKQDVQWKRTVKLTTQFINVT